MSQPSDSDAHRLRHIAEVIGGSDDDALRRLIETEPLVRAIIRVGNQPPSGMVGATLALADLREALRTIRWPHPAFAEGNEPTAADNCRHVLALMDWCLQQIAVYLGSPA